MPTKLDFTFKGFHITKQSNDTFHLILLVANDMAATLLYPALSMSTNISVSYLISNRYFDLFRKFNLG